jgi:hypothetical protein
MCHCFRFTLKQEFDPAIGKIMRVSTKPILLRRDAHEIPKAYALHATSNISFHAMHGVV